MMRGKAAKTWVMVSVAAAGALLWLAGGTPAHAASAPREAVSLGAPVPSEMSAQSRKRRGPTRLRVYPNYSYPGPNAVRQCEAHYEEEHRQSGTVIVPRMHCWWQPG